MLSGPTVEQLRVDGSRLWQQLKARNDVIRRAWDIQWDNNWWFSLGFHIDHTDPSITIHLPGIVLSLGRLKQPGFRYSFFGRR